MQLEDLDAPNQPAAPSRKNVVTAYLVIALTYLIGGGSMILWALFISPLDTFSIDLHLAEPLALMVDVTLCLAFFIAHSGMMRQSFRTWLGHFLGPQYHSALFSIVSGLLLIACVTLWQKSAVVFFHAQGAWALPFYALMMLAFAGFLWGGRALGTIDMLGTSFILRHLRGKPPRVSMPFVVRGPYQWMRHPLYLFCLMFIWSHPVYSLDRVVHNALWTAWIVIGAMLEERDLLAVFGGQYRDYQSRVPMLIPRILRPTL